MVAEDKTEKGRRRKNQRQTGTKLYQAVLEVGRRPDGTRDRKYFYGATNKEAKDKKEAYKRQLELQLNGGIDPEGGSMTVDEWGAQWLESYKSTMAYNTRRMYETTLRTKIEPAIGSMLLRDVRHIHLQKLANEHAGMSESTLAKLRITLGQLFKSAYKNHLIERNPAEDITMPTGTSGSHRALDRWEIDLVAENWKHHRCGIWAMLLLFAGVRRGEMMALKWTSVDMEKKVLRVSEAAHFESNTAVDGSTKTEAGVRDIPIVPPLYDALVAEKAKASPSGFVCTGAAGEQITMSSMKRGWTGMLLILNKAANGETPVLTPGCQPTRLTKEERAALTPGEQKELAAKRRADWERVKFTPHDLRHTYATMLYDAGVDVKTAQYLLGHKGIQMTMQLYTHLSEERKTAAITVMEDYFSRWGVHPSGKLANNEKGEILNAEKTWG